MQKHDVLQIITDTMQTPDVLQIITDTMQKPDVLQIITDTTQKQDVLHITDTTQKHDVLQIITDTTQKHDVLQIITILGNCKLEYSTKTGHFCRKCNSLSKPHELFRLNLLLEIHTECVERIENGLRKFDKHQCAK